MRHSGIPSRSPRPRRAPAGVVAWAVLAGMVVFGIGSLIGYAYGTHDSFFVTNSPATRFFGRSAFVIGSLGLGAGPVASWWYTRRSSTLTVAVGLALTPIAIALWLVAS